jgi:hypothetical protein
MCKRETLERSFEEGNLNAFLSRSIPKVCLFSSLSLLERVEKKEFKN